MFKISYNVEKLSFKKKLLQVGSINQLIIIIFSSENVVVECWVVYKGLSSTRRQGQRISHRDRNRSVFTRHALLSTTPRLLTSEVCCTLPLQSDHNTSTYTNTCTQYVHCPHNKQRVPKLVDNIWQICFYVDQLLILKPCLSKTFQVWD